MNGFIKVVGVKTVSGKPTTKAMARVCASSVAAVVIFEPSEITVMLDGGHTIEAEKSGNEAVLAYASSNLSSSSTS